LDSQPIQDRENVVVTLTNMKADTMQTALDQFFQAESQRLSELGESISPQKKMEEEVTIVGHKESNQLIVSTSPRYKSKILQMIEELDLPPPEVMIQVMIAEVSLDNNFQMGLEFALQNLRFSETAIPDGNGVLQSSHFDVVGGTDLGAAGTGVAGFSFTITGEDFNFLVRALQADSRLEVIQRPMIMCQDNQKASINIGQNVPFIRGTQVQTTGQVTSQVEYEQVGIKLEIEPVINPDGYVYLHVVQEISAITTSTVDIGNGVLAPIFTDRNADTYVAVKDGETVVIGGLIVTNDNESENKVPILGDIPGLGILFRATNRTKSKDELLIALTPRIIRTVEDGRRMSIEERDRGGIITDELKQSPLMGGLRRAPESQALLEGIEAPPVQPTPSGPTTAPAPKEGEPKPEKKYGPEAPHYGPLVPGGDDDLVAEKSGNDDVIHAGSVR
jgi:type II secretion system protein D